ncbi:MCM7 [Auxenochlorella protothecoides x Auxenochlorella symbiontica]
MVDFARDKETLVDFLENYSGTEKDGEGHVWTNAFKYCNQLQAIVNRERATLEVDLDDVASYVKDGDLVHRMETNTQQYLSLLASAADEAMPAPTRSDLPDDIFDILLDQRRRAEELTRAQMEVDGRTGQSDPNFALPAALTRRFEVCIRPRSTTEHARLRQVGAAQIGHLVTFRGIVTQVTDVRPLLTIATYLDDQTGFEIYQEVAGKTFTPLAEAPAAVKAMNGGKSELHLQTRGSKFVRYQECKVQELPEEVPQGSTPRTLTVQLRDALTRRVKAGDAVTVSGIFLPEPYAGPRSAMRATLLTATYVQAMAVTQNKQSYQDMRLDGETRAAIEALTAEGDVYGRLASSIAPEIWGHEDVKRVLLLCMVGGVSRQLPDGMKLRGDVHACLMGDPGVAKSQLLRYVCHVSPRAVYTTGKGSSGVGLTAAVMRDPTTGEMVLEGGALVMADRGICCIDEFDKMEEGDRTAIHEVMEQQSVSIAKAGIATTLNTRTTLLAAANPAFGRYDVRRSPAENINLPAALLSRFDVLWLILDRPGLDADLALAQHVLTVHREGAPPATTGPAPLPAPLLRAYIAAAKSHEPVVPAGLTDYLAAVYAEMRSEEAAAEIPHTYTTARTLLSILRLSQALARLRFADSVEQSDVDESLRLLKMSKASLYDDGGRERAVDPVSAVFSRIRQHAERTRATTLSWAQLLDLLGTSFKPEHIRQCLVDYASINVWQLEGAEGDAPTIYLAPA